MICVITTRNIQPPIVMASEQVLFLIAILEGNVEEFLEDNQFFRPEPSSLLLALLHNVQQSTHEVLKVRYEEWLYLNTCPKLPFTNGLFDDPETALQELGFIRGLSQS